MTTFIISIKNGPTHTANGLIEFRALCRELGYTLGPIIGRAETHHDAPRVRELTGPMASRCGVRYEGAAS
jgi:hypothetical protein